MSGTVEALWIKRALRGVMDPVDEVALVENGGIANDANFGRSKRQVTVIEKEIFDAIARDLPDVAPAMRRANVMVSGVELNETRDHVLTLGDVRIRIHGRTRPCERMDEQLPGLTAALDPAWYGGAYGVVLNDGTVSVGDSASVEVPVAEPALDSGD